MSMLGVGFAEKGFSTPIPPFHANRLFLTPERRLIATCQIRFGGGEVGNIIWMLSLGYVCFFSGYVSIDFKKYTERPNDSFLASKNPHYLIL